MRKRSVKTVYRTANEYGRAEGDAWVYFAIHNLTSMITFLILSIPLNTIIVKEDSLSYLISFDFLLSFLLIMGIYVLIDIFSRVFSFYLIQWMYKGETKTFIELNFQNKINKLGMRYAVMTVLSSLAFCAGILYIAQEKLFGDDSLKTLIYTYLIIKIVIIAITIIFVRKG